MEYRLADDVEWKKMGEESLLLVLSKSEFYKINSTGTLILEMVKEGGEVSKISGRIQDEYDVNDSDCGLDVEDFLKKLLDSGVIVES